MQLDTKLAFLKIASRKQLCVVMINIQYSCVVATSFVHRADIWSNLEEAMTRQMLTASRGEPENACTCTINIIQSIFDHS